MNKTNIKDDTDDDNDDDGDDVGNSSMLWLSIIRCAFSVTGLFI